MGSSNSTGVSVKHNETTSTSTFLQCLFTQYLHKVAITILCLQLFLQINVHADALRHLYKDPHTVIHLQPSLLTSLRSEFPRPPLLTSLWNKFLQLSLLVSLQSNFPLMSLLTSLWKIFLRRLYKDIPTVTPIPSKPEMFLQYIQGFMIIPEQVKPESPELWMPSRSSIQPYVKWFYKFVTYDMFDHNYNIDTRDIRRQLVGYSMALKKKLGEKLKGKECSEGWYHHMFKNLLESSSDLLRTNTHKGCSAVNATDFNYILRSAIGREDNYSVTKWT